MDLGKQMLRWKDDVLQLSRPAPNDAILSDALQNFFPLIEWHFKEDSEIKTRRSVEDISRIQEMAYSIPPMVSVCSFRPELDKMTFGWLHKLLHAPDNFLYLIIKPNELETSPSFDLATELDDRSIFV